jgi:hypothetical protein
MSSDTENNCSWAAERVGRLFCPLGNGHPLLWSSRGAQGPLTSSHSAQSCEPHDNAPHNTTSDTPPTAIMGVPFEALLPYAIMTGVCCLR